MDAKEKAKELIDKMYLVHSNSASQITLFFAKESALVTAKEIWKELESARVFEDYDFWHDVKEEIKKFNYENQINNKTFS